MNQNAALGHFFGDEGVYVAVAVPTLEEEVTEPSCYHSCSLIPSHQHRNRMIKPMFKPFSTLRKLRSLRRKLPRIFINAFIGHLCVGLVQVIPKSFILLRNIAPVHVQLRSIPRKGRILAKKPTKGSQPWRASGTPVSRFDPEITSRWPLNQRKAPAPQRESTCPALGRRGLSRRNSWLACSRKPFLPKRSCLT